VRHLARGTSLTHRTVLATLVEDGPTRLTALAAATAVTQPAMTQSVGRMEREGLVVRLVDPEDARATLVDITAAGRALRARRQRTAYRTVYTSWYARCPRPPQSIWLGDTFDQNQTELAPVNEDSARGSSPAR
jgi:DNA-binding MarR family transcriptional regulator